MASMNPNDPETVLKSAAEKVAAAADSLPDSEALRAMAKDGLEQAREFAKQNPLLVVAAGFGLGVLIGAWLKRD
jgi:ElaB/YqjD/DUF883 family membrane-anchored ribosome-binding protein